MSIYKHFNYRSALEEKIEIKRNLPGKWSLRRLAEEVGLQASYLTNVLKGRMDFSEDQLYSIAGALEFTPAERKFLLMLLSYERSSHKSRKQELKDEIEALRKQHQKTENRISVKTVELEPDAMADYYLDPFVQIAHVHLNLPEYTKDPERLCQVLGISKQHLAQILNVLVRIRYVKIENGAYKVIARNRHLPRESHLLGPHQALMRLKSIDQMQRLTTDETYSFSATLTGTDETRTQLQEAFLGFLKKAEAIVTESESEEKVIQMNFDLFPWKI